MKTEKTSFQKLNLSMSLHCHGHEGLIKQFVIFELFKRVKRLKLELAKYYKDSEMTAFISERSRNSKYLKKYDPP